MRVQRCMELTLRAISFVNTEIINVTLNYFSVIDDDAIVLFFFFSEQGKPHFQMQSLIIFRSDHDVLEIKKNRSQRDCHSLLAGWIISSRLASFPSIILRVWPVVWAPACLQHPMTVQNRGGNDMVHADTPVFRGCCFCHLRDGTAFGVIC